MICFIVFQRDKRVVEEPEVIYEASDEESENEETVPMIPTHRLPAPSDSERFVCISILVPEYKINV